MTRCQTGIKTVTLNMMIPIAAVLLIIIASVCSIIWPKTIWYLTEGWRYKNVEPSDLALTMIRVGGIAGILWGLYAVTMIIKNNLSWYR